MSLPARIDRGDMSVTCRGASVRRSRSPATDPAVMPGTMNSTSTTMNVSSVSNMERPTDAAASGSGPTMKVLRSRDADR